MNDFILNFHLLRPLWLLATIPALLLAVLLAKNHRRHGQWHQFIPAHLASLLIDNKVSKLSLVPIITLVIIWLLAIVALSGPSWQKVTQPLFKVNSAQVIVMDMSLSMYATDIKPNRLTRARFKVTDLIKSFTEGETGLVAYAGDAFVISPMTEDVNNLLNLLPVLAPEIMPVLGSDPASGIESAITLFEQSHKNSGEIYLISDGITSSQQHQISQLLSDKKYQLHVLAIGGHLDAPIQLPSGELLKDANGNIVLPKLNTQPLKSLAKQFGGRFSLITQDRDDIDYLSQRQQFNQPTLEQEQEQFGDRWQEAGPYLLLLILPLAALAFRRGVIISILLLTSPLFFNLTIAPVFAVEPTKQSVTMNQWDRLWINDDQLARKQFKQQQFEQAAANFKDSQWQGASHYQQGDYEQALAAYSQSTTAQSLYNQGNSLMQMQRYQEAIERYQQALVKQPDLDAATQNTELANKLLKQQKKQQQDQNKSDGDNQDSADKDSDDKDSDDNNESTDDNQQQSDKENQSSQNEQQSSDSQSEPSKENDQASEANKKPTDDESKQAPQQQKEVEQTEQEGKGQDIHKAPLFDPKELSKEQRQRLQQLVNKVNDDPSLLLKNKMALEARKRRNQRVLNKDRVNW